MKRVLKHGDFEGSVSVMVMNVILVWCCFSNQKEENIGENEIWECCCWVRTELRIHKQRKGKGKGETKGVVGFAKVWHLATSF